MNYQEQLNPWVIHQLKSDLTRSVVIRFRRRNEAEAYLKVLSQLRPRSKFAVAFEAQAAGGVLSGQDPIAIPVAPTTAAP